MESLLKISRVIDTLWKKQIQFRKEIENKTSDLINIYGMKSDITESKTTIREKDWIYNNIYRSQDQQNAGPYARLKFAMDYWCSLWFWPIDKAEYLPNRSQFIFDMSLILEGGIVSVDKQLGSGQLTLFPTPLEEMAQELSNKYMGSNIFSYDSDLGKVDLEQLCNNEERLKITKEISKEHRFFHWELEFADIFSDRGGFDLIIGNPPWIKMTWREQGILSEIEPSFAVKNYNASRVKDEREKLFENEEVLNMYLREYESMNSIQTFIKAPQNYRILSGQQTNLYKCFLPQAWQFTNSDGVFSFIHPDGVFDDPKGSNLRKEILSRMEMHFQFINEKLLFNEVSDTTIYSLNIYSNKRRNEFKSIFGLYYPSTIDDSFDSSNDSEEIPEIKDINGKWNIKGHRERIIKFDRNSLKAIAKVFDDESNAKGTKIPSIYTKNFIKIITQFSKHYFTIDCFGDDVYMTQLLDETNAQKKGIIHKQVGFYDNLVNIVYSGPYISICNPLFKTPRAICVQKADYDRINLSVIPENYIQRANYTIDINHAKYYEDSPVTKWGKKYIDEYRLVTRKMLGLNQSRTLMSAIIPPKTSHINGIFGMAFKDNKTMVYVNALFSSIPFDYIVRITGKSNFLEATAGKLPLPKGRQRDSLIVRALMLNCLTTNYSELWSEVYNSKFVNESWSKADVLLVNKFNILKKDLRKDFSLRTDYERRQALVEIDVLSSMILGLTLNQLKSVYRLQFPVFRKYEEDTWYDMNGSIVFTNDKSLVGVGLSRKEFEEIKFKKNGEKKVTVEDQTISDETLQRTVEYVAPFNKCDREKDYEIAWKFFEDKFKDVD